MTAAIVNRRGVVVIAAGYYVSRGSRLAAKWALGEITALLLNFQDPKNAGFVSKEILYEQAASVRPRKRLRGESQRQQVESAQISERFRSNVIELFCLRLAFEWDFPNAERKH